jgi:hypothetical protein
MLTSTKPKTFYEIEARKKKFNSLEISREEALIEVSTPYPVEDGIVEYTIGKLGVANREFDKIMKAPIKSFLDYPSYFPLIQLLRWPIKIACKLHIFPPIFYYKYGVNHTPKIKDYWKKFNSKQI